MDHQLAVYKYLLASAVLFSIVPTVSYIRLHTRNYTTCDRTADATDPEKLLLQLRQLVDAV
jgi:hypothetical protein